MKEVEIKAKLKNKEKVIERLSSLGCVFEPAVSQEDVVYVERIGSLQEFRSNDVFLRIRVKNGKKVLFTVKKRMANDLDAIEHETEIGSKDEMHQALLLMGYHEAVRVSKSRVITRYDGCEICIDNVAGLGDFIEMEKLTKEGDSVQIQEELFVFFESLGIERADRVTVGYDILMLQKEDE